MRYDTGYCPPAVIAAGPLLIAAAGLCLAARPALAGGTPAGVSIVNVATATYTDDRNRVLSVTSNSVAIRVEEVLDVLVTPVGAQPLTVAPGQSKRMLTFRVVNSGNGPEGFSLVVDATVAGDQFDPTGARIVIDSNGDRTYDPLSDASYAPGAEPLLPPDGSLDVFVFADIPATTRNGDEGRIALDATALTGSGAPGTLFAGRGEGGSDAVVGTSSAHATTVQRMLVSGTLPTLVKAQELSGPPSRGSVVTYSLTAELAVAGIAAPHVSDPIPAGTRYVAGSMTLDGAALSDADDGDAGTFTGAGIDVALDASRGGNQVVTFQVEID